MIDASVEATLSIDDAVRRNWDVVVIGAGPSGTVTARQCAFQGADVLLVNEDPLPRGKVCGCCLNHAALDTLRRIELADLVDRCDAPKLNRFVLASGSRCVPIHADLGVSLSRARLDAALAREAVAEDVAYLDRTRATVGVSSDGFRQVLLRQPGRQESLRARVVVAATGLGRRFFEDRRLDRREAEIGSRIGAGLILADDEAAFQDNTIYMACHADGYVGLVRLEDGRLDVAAALDAQAVRREGGVGTLARQVIASAGLPVPSGIDCERWRGTTKLTRSGGSVYADRVFVVGDAAGYVEPFTGEGMAWALASAVGVSPLVVDSIEQGTETTGKVWARTRQELLGRRMQRCRAVSGLLRRPRLVRLATWGLSQMPSLATPLVRSLNRSFREQRA